MATQAEDKAKENLLKRWRMMMSSSSTGPTMSYGRGRGNVPTSTQPPGTVRSDGSAYGLISGLSRQQLVSLFAAVPLLITLGYPLLKRIRKRFSKRPEKVRYREIASVHINERKRPSTNRRATLSPEARRSKLLRARQLERFTRWGISVRQLDPRLQIFQFFTEVAAVGASKKLEHCKIHITGGCTHNCLGRKDPNKKSILKTSLLTNPSRISFAKGANLSVAQYSLAMGCFDQASVFTVWRPTSQDAIRKMIRGDAVGKGLDIKGKSAVKGKLSSLVPVLQIHEDKHKAHLRHIPKEATMRLYFQSKKACNIAQLNLDRVLEEMIKGYKEAAHIVKTQTILERMLGSRAIPLPAKVWEQALNRQYRWEIDDELTARVRVIDDEDMASNRYGLELPQRVFVEAYIFRGDCHREIGSEDDTGRSSIPSFQDMNLETLRKPQYAATPGKGKKKEHATIPPRPVAFQYNTDPLKAMDPKDLVMAYEANGRVLPVVSDFDCFLVGTRRVAYKHGLPPKQLDMMTWCVDHIEQVLDEAAARRSNENNSWTMDWLEVLKKERVENGFKPSIPKYGYADPKSYAIMGHAIHHLQDNGCVRHGAECFNYYFPQDLDKDFLVVSYDIRESGNRWRKFGQQELLQFLSEKVDEGFMFPLNPKWILCDPGWKSLYDKQLQSTNPSVQQSIKAWYPPSSGIRERIEAIHAKHPMGFQEPSLRRRTTRMAPGEFSMDQALLELDRCDKLAKAKKAFRAIIAVNRMKRSMGGIASGVPLEDKGVRGASLGKGALPPKKEVLRVRVPKEALPGREGDIARRSQSFNLGSWTREVPILRSMSFDFGSQTRQSITALLGKETLPEAPRNSIAALPSQEVPKHHSHTVNSIADLPNEETPPPPGAPTEASRKSWAGARSKPAPVRPIPRRHRSMGTKKLAYPAQESAKMPPAYKAL